MKWNSKSASISLSERDMTILSQCHININDVLDNGNVTGLPPLKSILFYEMLRNDHLSLNRFWREYRSTQTLARNRDMHYSSAHIEKNSSGTRELNIPDRYVTAHQRFILREILNRIPVSKHAFAYRKGVGLKDCAEPHVGHDILIHLDISNFFSSITEHMVFDALLEKTGYSKQMVGFLARMCCYEGRLPQGACTSPALSNICFKACDDQLSAYAEALGLIYTRYSDDLFFSGSIPDVSSVLTQLNNIVESNGFHLNHQKAKVLGKHNAQHVVGLVTNEKLQVSREYRRELRKELYYLKKFGEGCHGAKSAPNYLTYLWQLQGKLSFVLYADPDNAEFCKAKESISALIKEQMKLYDMDYYNLWREFIYAEV